MSWFNNLGIQTKLLAGFGATSIILAIIGLLGISTARSMSNNVEYLGGNALPSAEFAGQAEIQLVEAQRDVRTILLASDDATTKAANESFNADLASLDKAWTDYKALDASPAEEAHIAAIDAKLGEWRTGMMSVRDKGMQNTPEATREGTELLLTKVVPAGATLVGDFDGISELLNSQGEDAHASAISNYNRSFKILLGAMVLGALIGLGMGLYIARQIKGAVVMVVGRLSSLQSICVTNLEHGIKAIAAGDLTVDVQPATPLIPNPGKDEVGMAAQTVNLVLKQMVSTIASYNEARGGLGSLIGEVQQGANSISGAADSLRENSDQMAAATGQIATAINEVTRSAVNLSGLSQESAREIERVAAGSQQLAASASTSADSASKSKEEATQIGTRIQLVATASQQVAAAAEESRIAAQQGQSAVREAVTSMESIATAVQRASKTVDQLGEYGVQIGDIVKAIDEIAAQTNLLALNAAIEAARAGEQGRGFAVVAENVRSLAERSSESTKEIADLIAKVRSGTEEAVEAMAIGVRDVEAGRSITTQAGEALESIITSVQQSAQQMKQIASDVDDLSAGAGRIVSSAEGIAAMAIESANGASEMASGTTRVTEAIVQVSASSEETSASAEEVSASTEELSAQSEELAATANALRDMAGGLTKAAGKFKVA